MRRIFIDAGIEYIRISIDETDPENPTRDSERRLTLKNNDNISIILAESGIDKLFDLNPADNTGEEFQVYLTGKLAGITKNAIGQGQVFMPAAVLWSAAQSFQTNPEQVSTGIIDLSASGYMSICLSKNGDLDQDHLKVNPRCGAGTGVNLSRILQKLNIRPEDVDQVLARYLGESGRDDRTQIPIRTDRCGVFSSSATISDKNQGIPLEYALGVTLKSEVMKPCEKMNTGIQRVILTGGVFRWKFARDCAEDLLTARGVREIIFDRDQSLMIRGMRYLVGNLASKSPVQKKNPELRKAEKLPELPAFSELKQKYESSGIYRRMPDPPLENNLSDFRSETAVVIGMDIGSTMAKIVICDAQTKSLLYRASYANHGDTIETIKFIFREIINTGFSRLKISNIGITGSGRYQVQKALNAIYPQLSGRITVMVENYAHVWGSIAYAQNHIQYLKNIHTAAINDEFCLLIDIGGEDTKISSVSLGKGELFDNAMNIKCSAGTGSLMDTLSAMFRIENIRDAYQLAFGAQAAYGINATCAVFLMENARKMQAEGYDKAEILASCCHAIIENMARSLWDQIEFPEHTIVLLHGQTMLSDPLPLAVTHRLQEYMGSKTFCLVPEYPGHRACFGLVNDPEAEKNSGTGIYCDLNALTEREFEKQITICRGAACGDKNSRCARTKLSSGSDSDRISLTLGGCTAINEYLGRRHSTRNTKVPDAYREIWKFIDNGLPRSNDNNRLVIPRSFAISEKAGFFASIFSYFGIPVHVDNVGEQDVIDGQPLFTMDTCAPNIGAAGQFLRLAREPHKIILVPQIDFLPIDGESLGRTCTTNQGGVIIAWQFAKKSYPDAKFYVFEISLKKLDAEFISDQVTAEFKEILALYGIKATGQEIKASIQNAITMYRQSQYEAVEFACDFIESAIREKQDISIVSAREYILTPGIYDSHAGKLLHDKGVVAIPSYVFDVKPDKQFDFIYWKNPHDLLSRARAIADKRLHKILTHRRMSALIRQIETGQTDSLLSPVTVSTFRCGPDSITLPIMTEITKNIPSLLIQSDAMIAELAHLENRVNTHLNQLKKSLHNQFNGNGKPGFSIELLDGFQLKGHDKTKCVLYLPTMGDNRTICSVFKAAGFTVIDNYEDESFDLEKKVKFGRKYIGDAVCVPLTAVFSDMIRAVEDFRQRKAANDPLVTGRDRVLLFMQSGDGPCRQGQYIDICKLNLYKRLNALNIETPDRENTEYPINILANMTTSLSTQNDFMSELEDWAAIQVFHGLVIKDVLEAIYLEGSSKCADEEAHKKFIADYRGLKETIFEKLSKDIKPGYVSRKMIRLADNEYVRLGGIAKYFGYGFYNNNGLRKILKEFVKKSMPVNGGPGSNGNGKLKIHVDGEVYLRVVQLADLQKIITDNLGYNRFRMSYTPVWSYFEYILESRIVQAQREIEKYQTKIGEMNGDPRKAVFWKLIKAETKKIRQSEKTSAMLRNILAKPLYKAADLKVPSAVRDEINTARSLLPTLKPEGELIPYVGASIKEIEAGTDLVLNIAPEGCMVASMGEMLSPAVKDAAGEPSARIQYLSSTDGEINEDWIRLSLLKLLGPANYYRV